MKLILAIAGIVLLVNAAMAPAGNSEICIERAAYARDAIMARQMGVSVEDAYQQAGDEWSRSTVLAAYKRPRFLTVAFQDEEVEQFVADQFARCINEGEKGK